MSDSQVDIEICFGQRSRLGHRKTLEVNFYESAKKEFYHFYGEIEVIYKNRSIQAYLMIIIKKRGDFAMNGVFKEK